MVLIGLDFDGVIADCAEIKQRAISEIYGIEIPIKDIRKHLMGNYGVTPEMYKHIKDIIYGTEYGLNMKEIPGSKDGIKVLKEKHDLKIVTSREGYAFELMLRWLENHNYPKIDAISTGYGNRKEVKLDILIDDDLDKFGNHGTKILFVHPYNECDVGEAEKQGILIVRSWENLLGEINKIETSKHGPDKNQLNELASHFL